MSPPYISFVVTNISRLMLMLFAVHRADLYLTCQILYKGHSGYSASVPTALYCIGSGDNGNWTKIENGTEIPIARFNRTDVDLQHKGYGVTVFTTRGNGTLETFLNLTRGDNGTFACTIGNETEVLYVPMLIRAGGMYHGHNVSLQCMSINKNISDPDHVGVNPYNITWFLNSTIVGWSQIYNDTYSNITYNVNSSFVQMKNITLHDNWGHTNTTRPACLTCLLSENGGFGSSTLCSPNTRDYSTNHLTIEDVLGIGTYSALKDVENDVNDNNINIPGNTSIIFICSFMLICMITSVLTLVHFRKEQSNNRSARRPYISFDFQSVDIKE